MSKIPIPPEALEAAFKAYLRQDDLDTEDAIEAACLAMLQAWPGMREIVSVQLNMAPAIILPLPQETSDE